MSRGMSRLLLALAVLVIHADASLLTRVSSMLGSWSWSDSGLPSEPPVVLEEAKAAVAPSLLTEEVNSTNATAIEEVLAPSSPQEPATAAASEEQEDSDSHVQPATEEEVVMPFAWPAMTIRVTAPVTGVRVYGSRAPLQVLVESEEDLSPLGDVCVVVFNHAGGEDIMRPLRSVLPPHRWGVHAVAPLFYDGEQECVGGDESRLCYNPTMLPGPRRLQARVECQDPISGGMVLVATSEPVQYSATALSPRLDEPALADLSLTLRRGDGEPISVEMQVDWQEEAVQQAHRVCVGVGMDDPHMQQCVKMVSEAVEVRKEERLHAHAISLMGSLRDNGIDFGQSEGTTYSCHAKVDMMRRLVAMPHVKRVCEIGFNMGHSSLLWLLFGGPEVTVLSFDLGEHAYSPLASEWVLDHIGKRLEVVLGDSKLTVPAYAKMHSEDKCDLIMVDGGHTDQTPLMDLINMRALANPAGAYVIVDDTDVEDVARAVQTMQQRGELEVLEKIPASHSAGLVEESGGWLAMWNWAEESEMVMGRYTWAGAS